MRPNLNVNGGVHGHTSDHRTPPVLVGLHRLFRGDRVHADVLNHVRGLRVAVTINLTRLLEPLNLEQRRQLAPAHGYTP